MRARARRTRETARRANDKTVRVPALAVEKQFTDLFAGPLKGSTHNMTVSTIKFVRPDVAAWTATSRSVVDGFSRPNVEEEFPAAR
jgi:hypothetical protein